VAEYTIRVSPSQLLTRSSNKLQVTVESGQSSVTSLSLLAECRLIVGEKVKEAYLVSEKKYTAFELSQESPLTIQWSVDVPRKGPVTFSCQDFSIQYVAVVEVTDKGGSTFREELPLAVVPGRITESEMESERQRSGAAVQE